MCKIVAKWVPCHLNEEQQQLCYEISVWNNFIAMGTDSSLRLNSVWVLVV